jgi:hypothetical protein
MGELLSQLNQQFVEHMGLLEPSLNPLVFAKLNKSEVMEDYDYGTTCSSQSTAPNELWT